MGCTEKSIIRFAIAFVPKTNLAESKSFQCTCDWIHWNTADFYHYNHARNADFRGFYVILSPILYTCVYNKSSKAKNSCRSYIRERDLTPSIEIQFKDDELQYIYRFNQLKTDHVPLSLHRYSLSQFTIMKPLFVVELGTLHNARENRWLCRNSPRFISPGLITSECSCIEELFRCTWFFNLVRYTYESTNTWPVGIEISTLLQPILYPKFRWVPNLFCYHVT